MLKKRANISTLPTWMRNWYKEYGSAKPKFSMAVITSDGLYLPQDLFLTNLETMALAGQLVTYYGPQQNDYKVHLVTGIEWKFTVLYGVEYANPRIMVPYGSSKLRVVDSTFAKHIAMNEEVEHLLADHKYGIKYF